jgi:hypothetical protein
MAVRNDEAPDPVGRACGVPLPPPDGGVTPCCSRHSFKDELRVLPEPEPELELELELELEEPLHAATPTTTIATSAKTPRTAGWATRRIKLRLRCRSRILFSVSGRRIKRFLLAANGRFR